MSNIDNLNYNVLFIVKIDGESAYRHFMIITAVFFLPTTCFRVDIMFQQQSKLHKMEESKSNISSSLFRTATIIHLKKIRTKIVFGIIFGRTAPASCLTVH